MNSESAQPLEGMMSDVRKWFYYPIEMPITSDGQGPATVGVDAAAITYEVWDRLFNTHGSFDNLPDAINEAMRLNDMSATTFSAADLSSPAQIARIKAEMFTAADLEAAFRVVLEMAAKVQVRTWDDAWRSPPCSAGHPRPDPARRSGGTVEAERG
jgi:hypothetical protein